MQDGRTEIFACENNFLHNAYFQNTVFAKVLKFQEYIMVMTKDNGTMGQLQFKQANEMN